MTAWRIDMKQLRIIIGVACCLLFTSSFATPYSQYPVSPPKVQQPPAVVLKQGIEQLTNFLAHGGGPNTPPLEVFLETEIAPLFDFAYMTKWVAGAEARNMNPQQWAELQQKIRRIFLTVMVDKLANYRHGRVQYLRPVGNPQSGEMRLRVLAFQQGNPYPQRISFKMYRSARGWKVYDASSDGQSALAFLRLQVAREARENSRPQYGAYQGVNLPRGQY